MNEQQRLMERAGQCLYGDAWQAPLARLLGVNDRTVRRWASGDTTYVDDAHWARIVDALATRRDGADKVRCEIVAWFSVGIAER